MNGDEVVVVGALDVGYDPFVTRLVDPLELEGEAHVLVDEEFFDVVLGIGVRHPLQPAIFEGDRLVAEEGELPRSHAMLESIHGRL